MILNAGFGGSKVHSNRLNFTKERTQILLIVAKHHSLKNKAKLRIYFLLHIKKQIEIIPQSHQELELHFHSSFEHRAFLHPPQQPSTILPPKGSQKQTTFASCLSRPSDSETRQYQIDQQTIRFLHTKLTNLDRGNVLKRDRALVGLSFVLTPHQLRFPQFQELLRPFLAEGTLGVKTSVTRFVPASRNSRSSIAYSPYYCFMYKGFTCEIRGITAGKVFTRIIEDSLISIINITNQLLQTAHFSSELPFQICI